eukprot:3548344-Lingulodinium_polyedra.AAC.1
MPACSAACGVWGNEPHTGPQITYRYSPGSSAKKIATDPARASSPTRCGKQDPPSTTPPCNSASPQ